MNFRKGMQELVKECTWYLLRDIAFPLTPALSLGERENISSGNSFRNHRTSS
jgi:hypothetical protein